LKNYPVAIFCAAVAAVVVVIGVNRVNAVLHPAVARTSHADLYARNWEIAVPNAYAETEH
jgi:hypothetical protein